MEEFDAETKSAIGAAKKSAAALLALNHAEQKLELRETHLKELAEAMRSLDPEEVYTPFWLLILSYS